MFNFEKKYLLKNAIVELIPLEESHMDLLYEVSNNKKIWKYFTENGFGRENFKRYINNAIQNRVECKEYPFAIKDLRINEYAGITRIYDVSNSLRNVKIGHTWIGERFQGSGLNKNCKYVLFEFLFDQLEMKRIGFGASSENIRSIKAMESVGCIKEGVLRSFLPSKNNDQRVDIVLLSILYEEWDSKIRKELKQKIETYT